MELWLAAGFCLFLALLAVVRRVRSKQSQARAKALKDARPTEKDRMLGLALQAQGQLDLAFDHFRRAPSSPALQDNLNLLALELERRQQFKKAQAVRDHMAACAQGLAVTEVAVPAMRQAQAPSGLQSGTLIGGRYKVGRWLGKGAMGVVCLGHDTQSGCVVALKTIALSDEFEGTNLLDA